MKSTIKSILNKEYKELGLIDKKVDKRIYTEAQHNKKTKIVLKKTAKEIKKYFKNK